jgi:initiation factor 1A
MPNNTGGKKFKAKKKRTGPVRDEPLATKSMNPKYSQKYAQVNAIRGGSSVEVQCNDELATRQVLIPGRFKNRVWMKQGDIILVEVPSESKGGEILHRYSNHMANNLKSQGLIKFDVKKEDESNVVFGESNEGDEDEDNHDVVDKMIKDQDGEDSGDGKSKKELKEEKKQALKDRAKEKDQKRGDDRQKKGKVNIDDI